MTTPNPDVRAALPEPAWRRELRLLLSALQFFTRVPVPRWVGHGTAQLNDCLRWFPVVGLGVGGVSAALWFAVAALTTPAVGIVAAMAAGVLLTGGFHEDGLADSCDGFGGGWTREQVLAIMKDSRVGSYAVIGLVLVLLGKFVLLSGIEARGLPMLATLLAAHAASRWMAASIVYRHAYVRLDEGARAKPVAEAIGIGSLVFAGLTVLPALAWLGGPALGGLLACGAVRAGLGRYFERRLGGYTGDALGATQQGCELAFYLGALATPAVVLRLGW